MALRFTAPKVFSAACGLRTQARQIPRQTPSATTTRSGSIILSQPSRQPFSHLAPSLNKQDKGESESDRADIGLSSSNTSTKRSIAQANQDAVEKESGGGRGATTSETANNDSSADDMHPFPDAVAAGDAKGKTGGGQKLGSSSDNAPPRPKLFNGGMPGNGKVDLTGEQQEEVDRHNEEFKHKFDRGQTAPDDKVDAQYWEPKKEDDKVDKEFWREQRANK